MGEWDPEGEQTKKKIEETQLELMTLELERQRKADLAEAEAEKAQKKLDESTPRFIDKIQKLISATQQSIKVVPPPSAIQVLSMCEAAQGAIANSLALRHATESVQHETFGLIFSALERERVQQWAKEAQAAK